MMVEADDITTAQVNTCVGYGGERGAVVGRDVEMTSPQGNTCVGCGCGERSRERCRSQKEQQAGCRHGRGEDCDDLPGIFPAYERHLIHCEADLITRSD